MQRPIILVTGAAGMLGQHLVRELEKSEEFSSFDIVQPTRSQLNLENHHEVQDWFKVHKPHTVFHLAAKVMGLRGNLDFQMQSMKTNLRINEALFAAASAFPPKRLFFAGTAASYAYPYRSMPLIEEDFFDGDVHAGEFGYAWAKRMAYPWLKLLASDFGVEWSYGIFTNLFGPNDRFTGDYTHVIPALINRAGSQSMRSLGDRLEVWGHPDVTRDFLFAPEAARGAVIALLNCSTNGLLANIASGMETSMASVANSIAREFEFQGVSWNSDMPIGVRNRVMSVSKLKQFGFSPELDFDRQIAETINWYKGNSGKLR